LLSKLLSCFGIPLFKIANRIIEQVLNLIKTIWQLSIGLVIVEFAVRLYKEALTIYVQAV